jgi:hypothetical protein
VRDARIVRNGPKIMSVRDNAAFVQEIAREHGSFGKFLASWPSSDEVGLLNLLFQRGARLGGNTRQMLLRFLGWDGFVTSKDVVACLRDASSTLPRRSNPRAISPKCRRSSMPGRRRPGCPMRICHVSARYRLARAVNHDLSAGRTRLLIYAGVACALQPKLRRQSRENLKPMNISDMQKHSPCRVINVSLC